MNYSISKDSLEEVLKEAFITLYDKDIYLIHSEHNEGDNHGSERAIVFRFAHYLQNLLDKKNILTDFNLDYEYNRDGYNSKSLPDLGNVIPDLIIHKRGSNEDNFLIMEFKTYWNKDSEKDIQKISAFMSKENKYKYKFGISVHLGKTIEKLDMKWI